MDGGDGVVKGESVDKGEGLVTRRPAQGRRGEQLGAEESSWGLADGGWVGSLVVERLITRISKLWAEFPRRTRREGFSTRWR